LPTFSGVTVALALACLVLIVGLRRLRPTWPGFLIAVVAGALLIATIHLPVATIGTRFGGIPGTLPAFRPSGHSARSHPRIVPQCVHDRFSHRH
jgi:sulfate permease, SulP family